MFALTTPSVVPPYVAHLGELRARPLRAIARASSRNDASTRFALQTRGTHRCFARAQGVRASTSGVSRAGAFRALLWSNENGVARSFRLHGTTRSPRTRGAARDDTKRQVETDASSETSSEAVPSVGTDAHETPPQVKKSKLTDSPTHALRAIQARSFEESFVSRSVQRAVASAVSVTMASRKPGADTAGPLTKKESDAIGEKVVAALRGHTKRRRAGRKVEYLFVRSALAATGFFVVMGVVASLALAGLLFTMGCREVAFDAVAAWIRFSPVELVTAAVGALDRFLLGMVCVIFGVGAFEVFLARKKNPGDGSFEPRNASLRRLRWLNIESVDDLEQQVSGIVVAILVVNILELSLHMTFSKPVDLVFASMAPLACASALALLHWSAQGAHGKAKQINRGKMKRTKPRDRGTKAARLIRATHAPTRRQRTEDFGEARFHVV